MSAAVATSAATTADLARLAADALGAGRAQWSAGALRESIALFRRAAELRAMAFGADDARTVDARRQLSAALASAGMVAEAAELMGPVVAASGEAIGRARLRHASDLDARARVLTRQRDWIAAEPVLRALVRECTVVHGRTASPTLAALAQLATAWQQLGRPAAAERCWRRLLVVREAAGAEPALLAALRDRLAECADLQERRADALTLRLQASRVRSGETSSAAAGPIPRGPAPSVQARRPVSDAVRPFPAVRGAVTPPAAVVAPAPPLAVRGPLAPLVPDGRRPDPSTPPAAEPAGHDLVVRQLVAAHLRRYALAAAAAAVLVAGTWTVASRQRDADAEPAPMATGTPASLGAPSTTVYQP